MTMTTLCAQMSGLTGIACHPLNDDGSVAMLQTPFKFADGDSIPVFVEKIGGQIRFFDDGNVLLHFAGRGVQLKNQRNVKFIKNAGEPHGVKLSGAGELEIYSAEASASDAFASYISTLNELASWEREQQGVASDLTLLIEEVEMCLRALSPAGVHRAPEFAGISGQHYKLDFDFDGRAVIAITPHKATVSSAIRKLLDIRSRSSNQPFDPIIVLDDRRDKEAAKAEGQVLNAVGSVWPMTSLEREVSLPS